MTYEVFDVFVGVYVEGRGLLSKYLIPDCKIHPRNEVFVCIRCGNLIGRIFREVSYKHEWKIGWVVRPIACTDCGGSSSFLPYLEEIPLAEDGGQEFLAYELGLYLKEKERGNADNR